MDGADSWKPLLVTVGLFLLFLACIVVMFISKLGSDKTPDEPQQHPTIEHSAPAAE